VRTQLSAGLRMLLVLTVLTGLAYPLAVTGVGQALFGPEADGSLVERDGRVVGSSLVRQGFSGQEWFHARPSAAAPGAAGEVSEGGAPADLADPSTGIANSGPSNLGPTNEDLLAAVEERVAAYREENGLGADERVPVDAVTTSASGLDPHISVRNAELQASRVAATRDIDVDVVLDLVHEHTSGRDLGVLGEQGVNVLELNLALETTG
jgi:K+-transporting ATPase ATPase C chain